MKLTVKLCRGFEVPCKWFHDVLSLKPGVYVAKDMILENLRQRFGLLSPGVDIWWPGKQAWDDTPEDTHYGKLIPAGQGWGVKGWSSVVCMDAMRFDLLKPGVMVKGIVQADPLDPTMVAQIDGALIGELARWGIAINPRAADWCQVYEGKADEVDRANRAMAR